MIHIDAQAKLSPEQLAEYFAKPVNAKQLALMLQALHEQELSDAWCRMFAKYAENSNAPDITRFLHNLAK